ncbi:MAG: tRNA (guanosine(46)-N(7))-methyltransferase TrmB [Hyphomicrobiales bacterium]
MTDTAAHPRRPLIYGRRQGHRLRGHQAELMTSLLPRLAIQAHEPAELDPQSLFAPVAGGGRRDIRLEVGFGGGEHLLARAAASPQTGFLGAEPFVNGIAKLLAGIEKQGLANIRIHPDDARDLIEWLAPGTIAGIDILYPDPWPKSRHNKRRFMRPETIAEMARIMSPGAELLFASDIADYVRWTEELMADATGFKPCQSGADRWRYPPADWPSTRYEKKALAAGRKPAYLTYRRK